MAQVTIFGASDDLVEIGGDVEGADEYSSDGHSSFIVEAPDGGTAVIYVDIRRNAQWSVAISRYDDDYPIPKEWNPRIVSDDEMCAYSSMLILDLPEGSTIKKVNPSDL